MIPNKLILLGIVFGVAAVIAMITIGEGAQAPTTDENAEP
jgi:ABC-type antimicrobial peptide transport system permease subunit